MLRDLHAGGSDVERSETSYLARAATVAQLAALLRAMMGRPENDEDQS
ncbi:MAG: hypothetical protein ABIQ08_17155 [Duganella sp.]